MKRFTEPSTWVAFAVIIAMIFNFDLTAELQEQIVTAGIAIVALVGAILKEAGAND